MKLNPKHDAEMRLLSDRRLYLQDLKRSLIEAEQRLASNDTPANQAQLATMRETEQRLEREIAALDESTRNALRDLARADAAIREGA